MRSTFLSALIALADADPRIVLLTADLGYGVIDEFAHRFPRRFFNVGVAEQNMIGVASGLAASGFLPFAYSITAFAVLRPYEFIRNGPVAHNLPVRIVGIGAGLEYALNGPTHYGLEDVALLRAQPGMTIVSPADDEQAAAALAATYLRPGPIYYRLSKDPVGSVPGLTRQFAIDRVQFTRSGPDLLIVTTGAVTHEAVMAADRLKSFGVKCAVGVVSVLSPAPDAHLRELLADYPVVITLEAHSPIGGLGSLVMEVAAGHGLGCRIVRAGIDPLALDGVGPLPSLMRRHRIDCDSLVQLALQVTAVRS